MAYLCFAVDVGTHGVAYGCKRDMVKIHEYTFVSKLLYKGSCFSVASYQFFFSYPMLLPS